MKNIVLYIGIATIILANACKEGRVTGVSLDRNKVEILVDEKFTLSATIQPVDAKEQTIYWESEDEKKVKVDDNGQITGRAASNGTSVRVSTKEGEFEDLCNVKVINKSFKNISNCSYNATGKPVKGVNEPAPDSWSGKLTCFEDDPECNCSYYIISNWANSISWGVTNEGIIIYLDYDNGKLYIDNYSDMAYYNDISDILETVLKNPVYMYFTVAYYDQKNGDFYEESSNYKYEVKYSLATNTIDFKGTTSDKKQATALLIAVNKNNSNDVWYFTDTAVTDVKFTLSSSQKSTVNEEINQNSYPTKIKRCERNTTEENNEWKVIPKEKIVSLKELLQ